MPLLLAPHEATRLARGAILLSMLTCGVVGCTSARKADYPHAQEYSLGSEYTYERNPDVKLLREYWIVIRADSGSYAMLPRPDGDPRIAEECATKGPLASLFENASLCKQASSSAALGRVNALTASEAMQTSTFLHQKLRFVATEAATELGGANVEPYAHTDDLLDICKTYAADRNGTLRAVCDEELRYENATSRPAIARRYSIDECRIIAPRLNELYGIR
ncbi:hypothetical protein BH11MYX4_BH11MYX4_34610 [soil metagenome]